MQRSTLIWGLLLVACTVRDPVEYDAKEDVLTSMVMQAPVPKPKIEEPEPPESIPQEDPYAGWSTWCEPMEYETVCKTDKDCADVYVEAIGRPLKCVQPWWSKSADLKICAPGYSGKKERAWRSSRLREIVRLQYFGETEHCALDGRPVHKEHWRCQREWRQAETLAQFLWLVYKRETTGRPYKRHRLNPDLDANLAAWVRRAQDYGWEVELACSNGRKRCKKDKKYVKSYKPVGDAFNPHYGSMHRWWYGLGGLGQNAALWTDTWDKMAPPEILCREVPSFETYLRRARRVVTQLDGGVDCDGDLKKDHWDHAPTWAVVHRGASGGKTCPPKNQDNKHEQDFRRRAKREGLDPDQVVTLDMLGTPIERENQNQRMAEIYAVLDEKLPHP